MLRFAKVWSCLLLLGVSATALGSSAKSASKQDAANDPRLAGAFRRPAQNGWIYVHLAGSPAVIGYQHGYLLAPEIDDALKVEKLALTHDNNKDWQFFRDAAQNMMWPHIEAEYRAELQGIADGAKAAGVKLDIWDVVALNAFLEWSYYVNEYDKQHGVMPPPAAPADHCSAFVATGSYTKDGRVVIAHNNWSSYLDGERWTIIFDIVPAKGQHFIMDGFPGLIHSGDDFGINSAGIVITETTISQFFGYDPNGIPEFVRARKAMQYSESIDDFARIMKTGNNGGYANDWLIADTKHNEIASLELGLKNVTLQRKRDGYFVSANFPIDPKLAKEETDFRPDRCQPELQCAARALGTTDGGIQGEDRSGCGGEVRERSLRRLRQEGRARRAHALRACRPFATRLAALGASLCACRDGAEQSHHGGDGCEYAVGGRRRTCVRHRLQGAIAPGSSSGVRLAEGCAARHGFAAVDGV